MNTKRKAGRPPTLEGAQRVQVMLDQPTIDKGKRIGAGNLSLGIRRAVKKYVSTGK